MRGLWSIVILVVGGCGKEKSDTESTPTPAVLADVVGSWKVADLHFEKLSDAVTIVGSAKFRFGNDGIYAFDTEGYTLSGGGVSSLKNCTSYQAGEFKVEDGTLFTSAQVNGDVAGDCGSKKMIYTSDGGAMVAGVLDGQLTLTTPFTYLDSSGASVADKATMTLNRIADANAVLDGTWRLEKAYYTTTECSPNEYTALTANLLAFSGTLGLKLDGNTYSTKAEAFAWGDGEKCSGTEMGTVTRSKLKYETKQTAADECLKEADDDKSTTVLEADFVSATGLLVSLIGTSEPTEACPKGEYSSILTVFKR